MNSFEIARSRASHPDIGAISQRIFAPRRRSGGLLVKLVTGNGDTSPRWRNLPLYRSSDLRFTTDLMGGVPNADSVGRLWRPEYARVASLRYFLTGQQSPLISPEVPDDLETPPGRNPRWIETAQNILFIGQFRRFRDVAIRIKIHGSCVIRSLLTLFRPDGIRRLSLLD